MNEEIEEINIRKHNMKLYPVYEMIGFDLLFYYGVKVLFLTQVKNISESNIIFASAMYALFTIILQIPINIIAERVNPRKITILGNIFNFIAVTLLIFCQDIVMYIFMEFISAIAFSLKNISQTSILNQSIPNTDKKSEIFTKIHSKGYSRHCYIDAITTIIAGYLFDINPYIPMCFCLLFIVFSTFLSYLFYDIKEEQHKKREVTEFFKEIKQGFKFIVKSNRLRSLLLMLGVLWGIISLISTYQVALLKEIDISATNIGIIIAILSISKGIISKKSHKANKILKNKTLTILAISLTTSFIIAGLIAITSLSISSKMVIILIVFLIEKGVHGVYQVLKPVYLNNFSNKKISSKIYSANSIMTNMFRMMIGFISSYILRYTNIQYAMIISGTIFTVLIILISKYMKTRVGLKPEEYKKEDIKFTIVE